MVIYDLDIPGFIGGPVKADAPLIVDADAVLTGTGAFKLFEPVARDRLHILQGIGIVQIQQFAARRALDLGREFLGKLPLENLLGLDGRKGLDHNPIISPDDNIVKR